MLESLWIKFDFLNVISVLFFRHIKIFFSRMKVLSIKFYTWTFLSCFFIRYNTLKTIFKIKWKCYLTNLFLILYQLVHYDNFTMKNLGRVLIRTFLCQEWKFPFNYKRWFQCNKLLSMVSLGYCSVKTTSKYINIIFSIPHIYGLDGDFFWFLKAHRCA